MLLIASETIRTNRTLNDLVRANSPVPTFRFAGLPITVEKNGN